MILATGPLDVNPTTVLLQPLFLLLSPVGGTAAVLPRTRTSQVSHTSPSTTPLPHLPHLRVLPVWGLASSTGLGAIGTVWSTTESHRKMTVRERLTVGTHHAHGRMHATERGVVNMVKERLPSEVYCTCEANSGDAPRPLTHACNGTRHGQCGQGTTSIGRVLYMERLTAESTTAARKCLLIMRKIMIPPPNSRDPPDGPPYFAKKTFPP